MVDVRWNASGVGFNGVGILAEGAEAFFVSWGDGTSEKEALNRDDNGDGVPDVMTLFHSYNMDGVYKITVSDRPKDPGTPNVQLRAYLSSNDPDGGFFRGTSGQDMFITGIGGDKIVAEGGNDWVSAAAGDDTVNGGDGDDVLLGGPGLDRIFGGEGQDLIAGQEGDDFIQGDAGMDFLYGEEGDDRIEAGADGAFMQGQAGRDILIGGNGQDRFSYEEADESPVGGADTIRGFTQGQDLIDVFAIFGDFDNLGFSFIGTDRFSGEGLGEVRYQVGSFSTLVSGDVNGDGEVDFQIYLNGQYTLTSEDFGIFSA